MSDFYKNKFVDESTDSQNIHIEDISDQNMLLFTYNSLEKQWDTIESLITDVQNKIKKLTLKEIDEIHQLFDKINFLQESLQNVWEKQTQILDKILFH